MDNNKLPIIDEALVLYLERLYPDVCPDISTSDREVWFKAGSVNVVRTLRRLLEDQKEDMLGS